MRLNDEHVAKIRHARKVADDPGKTNLESLGCPISRRFCEKWGFRSRNIINPKA